MFRSSNCLSRFPSFFLTVRSVFKDSARPARAVLSSLLLLLSVLATTTRITVARATLNYEIHADDGTRIRVNEGVFSRLHEKRRRSVYVYINRFRTNE